MPKYEIPAGSFVAEYAKSGRSGCKKCQRNIGQDQVRLGMLVQSRFFDGVQPIWNHVDCCLKGAGKKLRKLEEIFGFQDLRWEDQEKIREKITAIAATAPVDDTETTEAGRQAGLQVGYAKSNRSTCRACETFIDKDELRLAFMVDGLYGPVPAWHHKDCFFEHHASMLATVEDLSGWKALEEEDLRELKDRIAMKPLSSPAVKKEPHADTVSSKATSTSKREATNTVSSTVKKEPADAKSSTVKREPSAVDTNALRKQSQYIWSKKDWLREQLAGFSAKAAKQMLVPLFHANQCILDSKSEAELVDALVDYLCFGVPKMCSSCKQSRLTWDSVSNTYVCPIVEAWGHCTFACDKEQAELTPFVTPKECAIAGLNKQTKPLHSRVLPPKVEHFRYKSAEDIKKSVKAKSESGVAEEKEPERKRAKLTLKGRAAVDPDTGCEETHHILETAHGKVYNAILSASDVSTGKNSYYKLQLLEGDWVAAKPNVTGSRKTKRAGSGSAAYYVFRSWGRVGTTIGDSRLERCADKESAIAHFERLFLEKTGNEFGAQPMVKKPKMFFPLELSAPSDDILQKADQHVVPGSKTKLPAPVQELLRMIFDVEAMKRALLEMELDLSKMPLGQLSKQQIQAAYGILSQALGTMIDDDGKASVKSNSIISLTNQFYTLIPHDFGMKKPALLNSPEIIRGKLEMLDTMLEIEVATKIIEHDKDDASDADPFDVHYDALHADLEPLDKKSKEFKVISDYLETTHGPTHQEYKLVVDQVFSVRRHDEQGRYEEALKRNARLYTNRKLLWHGSRLTNFVGIISQGLRIAPKEAPSTGYMFGKGVYFSDVATKSANYCKPHVQEPEGLLVLSEVALGEMYEKTESEFIKKLPTGKDSTKGCGKYVPSKSVPFASIVGTSATQHDSQVATTTATAARRSTRRSSQRSEATVHMECPLGPVTEIKTNKKKSELLYNEFIVYNEEQSVMRYLVKVRFDFGEKKRGSKRQ